MQNNSNEGLPVAMGPPMAIDEEPDFDLIANLDHLKSALTRQEPLQWRTAIGRTALVGLSRQLHAMLHRHNANLIGPSPGPYKHQTAVYAVRDYIIQNRHLLIHPSQKDIIVAMAIPEFRLIIGQDKIPLADLANFLKRHLVLLDVTN